VKAAAALAIAVAACSGPPARETVVVYFAQWSAPDMQLVAQLDAACGRKSVRCIGIDMTDDGKLLHAANISVVEPSPWFDAAFGADIPPALHVYDANGHLLARANSDFARLLP
jgi:hypothetical protein